jgi:PAS domain S-box-containing protein
MSFFQEDAKTRSYAEALREMTLRYEALVQDLSILRQIDEFDDPELDLSEICQKLVETLTHGLAAENCSLMLMDPKRQQLELRAASSPTEDRGRYYKAGEWFGKSFRVGEGIVGQVAQAGEVMRIDDVTQCTDFVRVGGSPTEVRSLLCFPIRVRGKTIGVLNLSHAEPGFFTLDTEKTLAFVAERAGRLLTSRLLQQQLRESEARYRLVAENAADAILVLDLTGRVLRANPAVEKITGFAEETWSRDGTAWEASILPEDRPKFHEHRLQVMKSKVPVTVEYRYVNSKGEIRHLEQKSSALNDSLGQPMGMVAIIRDSTERKRRELEIKVRDSAIASSINAVALADTDGRLTYVNDSFLRLWEYTDPKEILGKPVEDFWQSHEAAAEIIGALKRKETDTGELVGMKKTGAPFHVLYCANMVRDERGKPVCIMASFLDLTERKHAEEERRRLETQVQQAQKLESLGLLASGIAHDFNNLLMGILGHADLALMQLPSFSPTRKSVQEIKVTAQRAADLTKELLAYSGSGKLVVEPVLISEVVREMTHLLEVSIPKKCALRYDFAVNLPAVEADVTQLRQIIMNLILNGSEAIGGNCGVVAVRTGLMKCDRAYLSETHLGENLPEGAYVYLEVEDTGCGMTAETRGRLFEPFFTTKVTGRGLGLAAVIGIVRGHRGTIRVYSEPGRGTMFRVLFPASKRLVKAPRPVAEELEAWHDTGTVLVVDDELTIRELTRDVLECVGFTVLTAVDGLEAVEVYRANADRIRFVLLDMTMPNMDGRETFEAIQEIRRDVPVILSSGFNEQYSRSRFAGGGPAEFIQKPYGLKQLLEVARRVVSPSGPKASN